MKQWAWSPLLILPRYVIREFRVHVQHLVSKLLQLAPIGVPCSTLEYSDQYCTLQRVRVGTELLSAYEPTQ